MKYIGNYQKIKNAIRLLVTEKGTQAERLHRAYFQFLSPILTKELPLRTQKEYKLFLSELGSEPDDVVGSVKNTTNNMHHTKSKKLCEKLFDIYEVFQDEIYQ